MEEPAGVGEDGGGLAGAGIGPGDEDTGSDLDNYLLDPILLAVLFAFVSFPIVAVSLNVADYGMGLGSDLMPTQVSTTDLGRWEAAFGAVMAAGLIAGTIGALLVRANAIWGGLLTIVIAWVVAIAALPVLPALLNANHGGALGLGSICPIGPGTCQAAITASDPASGLRQVWFFWFAPFVEPIPFALLVLGVAYWTRMVRSWTSELPATCA